MYLLELKKKKRLKQKAINLSKNKKYYRIRFQKIKIVEDKIFNHLKQNKNLESNKFKRD